MLMLVSFSSLYARVNTNHSKKPKIKFEPEWLELLDRKSADTNSFFYLLYLFNF